MPEQYSIVEGGEVRTYPAPFDDVTPEQTEDARQVEIAILENKHGIEMNFVRIGFLLDIAEKRKLYRARGYETLKAWVQSPEIDISYRLAHDLMRICREVVPMFGDDVPTAAEEVLSIGVSNTRAMLPLLHEEDGEQLFKNFAPDAKNLTWNDVREEVKRLRGLDRPIDEATPVVFKAQARRGEKYTRLDVWADDGVSFERLGVLTIRNAHMNRWEQRFGRFIEYADERVG